MRGILKPPPLIFLPTVGGRIFTDLLLLYWYELKKGNLTFNDDDPIPTRNNKKKISKKNDFVFSIDRIMIYHFIWIFVKKYSYIFLQKYGKYSFMLNMYLFWFMVNHQLLQFFWVWISYSILFSWFGTLDGSIGGQRMSPIWIFQCKLCW